MTANPSSGRLQSVPLLSGTPVTVVGTSQVALTAADILRAVGATVKAIPTSLYEADLTPLADDDIVVCDLVEEGADAGYLTAVAQRRRGAWVTVSAFGLDGPKGGEKGSDLVCAAAGGLLKTVLDANGRGYPMPGSQAFRVAGQAAALAALHGLSLVRAGEGPVHLDLSVQETVAFCSLPQDCAAVVFNGVQRGSTLRYAAPMGDFHCADGDIATIVIDDHQFHRVATAIDRPDWIETYPTINDRREHADEIDETFAAWARTRSKFTCEKVLQGAGVAACAIRTIREVSAEEHFVERGFLQPGDGDRLECPTLPALVTPLKDTPTAAPAPPTMETSTRTLAGLRVADVTNVLAGPLTGAIIGAMGGTVVRLEEPERLDIYRRNGPFLDGRPGLERAAYYYFANFNKRNISRRVGTDPGFAPAVATWADLVLENVGRRRLERLGIEPPAGVDKTLVSISGFGRTGPAHDYKAYANQVQAFGGLGGAIRELSDPEAGIRTVFADCCAAMWGATLATAWWLGGAPPYLFDLSMAEVMASKLDGSPLDAAEAPPPAVAPDLIVRCADGDVAVATGTRSYGDVLAAVGQEKPEEIPVTRSYAAAVADLSAISLEKADALRTLAEAGYAAYDAIGTAGIVDDPQLESRGFTVRLEHPEIGRQGFFALPWKIAGTRRDVPDGWYRRPPMLGEDDDWMDEQLRLAAPDSR